MRSEYVIPTEDSLLSAVRHLDDCESKKRGEVEESALEADLSARPIGLGRGDKEVSW